MIRVMLCDPESGETHWGDEELIEDWSPDGKSWIWADFDGEGAERESELFSRCFALDPLVITDAQNDRHPPKLVGFDDYFFPPLSLLAGIYGMTFEDMPDLKIKNAYFILLGVMATIAAGLLLLFRRLKWL